MTESCFLNQLPAYGEQNKRQMFINEFLIDRDLLVSESKLINEKLKRQGVLYQTR